MLVRRVRLAHPPDWMELNNNDRRRHALKGNGGSEL